MGARRSRVGSTPDTQRLAMAVQGPGIDTRIWTSLAYVTAVHVDPNNGPFADVILVPSQHTDTARFGSDYAGVGVGIFFPLAEGDELVVAAPSGDPDEGWVIVARVSSASDLPPAGWNNDSVTLYSDQPIQILGSTVRVGAPPSSGQPGANADMADYMLLGTTYRNGEQTEHNSEESAYTTLAAAMGVAATAATALSTAATTWGGSPTTAPAFATAVATAGTALSTGFAALQTAAQALLQALQTFEGNASSYLSQSAQVGK